MRLMSKANLIIIISVCLYRLPLSAEIKPGAGSTAEYVPLLKGKKIALVVNQTSVIGKTHLLDTLLALHIKVKKIFAPEHGFRGDASAGADIANTTDKKTGLPVVSLFGKKFKPAPEDMADIDIVVYDIQDVGARFYTYISTLHYVMEACAENNKQLIILDRPNPNGYYIDGPVLEKQFSSFVGVDPVPIVYGMTCGEYAMMLNGEGWLKGSEQCQLKVIKVQGYTHNDMYELPIAPSPNLPTMQAIYLYPSVCLFEGTDVSVGRGTDKPFEIIGKPGFAPGEVKFTPHSIPGKAEDPPYKGIECNGFELSKFADDYIKHSNQLYLFWLVGFYNHSDNKDKFFNPFFDKLAGTDKLRQEIIDGWDADKIRKSWTKDINTFKLIRSKYLLYTDFKE